MYLKLHEMNNFLKGNGYTTMGPASVAQLDARQTGDQEVVGLTPAGSATFFHGD